MIFSILKILVAMPPPLNKPLVQYLITFDYLIITINVMMLLKNYSADLEVTYKDQSTFTSINIDASRYPFGRNITFSMKTIKTNTSCLMLIQFLSNTFQESPTAYICVRISNGSLLINTKNDNSAIGRWF